MKPKVVPTSMSAVLLLIPVKRTQVHRIGKNAGLGIVIRRAVDVDLCFVEQIRTENVLQRDEVVGRVIDDILFVKERANRLVGVQDIALGTPVECGFVVEFVVDAHQRGIFVNYAWAWHA